MSVVMSEPGRQPGLMRRSARRVSRFFRAAWHSFCISSNEQWVAACESDGILDSHSLRAVRLDTQKHRVALALIEAEK